MNIDLNNILSQVCHAANLTGKYLVDEQAGLKDSAVEMKGARNYVSYVDKEAEKQLVEALKALIPNAGFLTEEDTIEYVQKDYTWIIDPLDGTSNYVHGYSPYSVSIALMYKQETILGVVFDPVANELFTAIKNERALLNNQPISVSNKNVLENSFICFGIPYDVSNKAHSILQNTFKHFGIATFRLKGSAAIEICYVACGRCDAYFHSDLSPWDVAAGAFILQQAGGKNTDFTNGSNYIFGKELVATNAHIHHTILDSIINLVEIR
ncbi:MAG: inositol monophosphatase family protein [Candidatus Saccharimonadaceae bacterium]